MAATAVVAPPLRGGHVGPYIRLQRDGNVATSSGEVCMSQTIAPRFKGVFPVVPTTFRDDGELDLDSQRRCLDFMIDAGSNGLCILRRRQLVNLAVVLLAECAIALHHSGATRPMRSP